LAFEKQFSSEKVVSARLMVCGLGFFEVYVNGKRIDERYFLPAFTDYEKRDLYKNRELLIGRYQRTFAYSYDVTEFLQGENILRILVGNGYYHNVDRPEEPYVSYGDKKLLFALRLCYEDREELLISDESVLVKYLSEVSGLYEGEYIDFSAMEDPFTFATLVPALKGEVQLVDAKCALGDVVGQTLYPISVKPLGKGLLYDFGINHSGGIVCSIKGARGRKVVIKFAEVLYDNGEPNYETSRWCAYDEKGALTHLIDQIGEYVLSGKEDFIQPRFRWNCYRYAYVEDATDLEIKDMRSYFIQMDVETGRIKCAKTSEYPGHCKEWIIYKRVKN
jgi:alpha-L-rhamnosidase